MYTHMYTYICIYINICICIRHLCLDSAESGRAAERDVPVSLEAPQHTVSNTHFNTDNSNKAIFSRPELRVGH